MVIASLWCTIYTVTLGRALWQKQNRRGAVLAGLLATVTLVVPLVVQWIMVIQ